MFKLGIKREIFKSNLKFKKGMSYEKARIEKKTFQKV